MSPDVAIVVGVIFGALALPSLISAYSESRPPRAAIMMIIIAGGLIVYAVKTNPSGYQLQDVPQVFTRVFGQFVN